MEEFILTGLLGVALITVCCFIIYEVLRHIWRMLPHMTWPPRVRVLVVVVGSIFIAHILNIWLFGIVYYLLNEFQLGTLVSTATGSGTYKLDFFSCIYFSSVTYSTLGLGDITPEGALLMITGVEGLTGFILIGWTVSFTYLAMEKFWELPHSRDARPPR